MFPIDRERCQAEKPNGQNFMTYGGGHKMIRCVSPPKVIATERNAGNDGLRGSMSMCENCLKVAENQLPKGSFDVVKLHP